MGRTKNDSGFNLVELMISVAIVGLLASMAVPNFNEFAKRARFAEAKANLSAIYTAETAFFTEFQRYTSRFDVLGFQPIGILWFNVGFDNDFAPPPEAYSGAAGCIIACPSVCPSTYIKWSCTPPSSNMLDGTFHAIVAAKLFTAGTHSHFSTNTSDWYTWVIDQSKYLHQIIPAN